MLAQWPRPADRSVLAARVPRVATALYRRYRPDTFAEVIGQDHVTAPLTAALTKDRVNHAYLFSGPRGCGKTTSARIMARCMNCAKGPTATPCGECESCRELARGGPGSLDVVEIDAASHGGVDDARNLRERAAYAPARDRYKIFIIDEAHMVSTQGFNALLKIVEEPPEHVRFLFATTEPDKVIGTIRSRTHHYPFRLVPPERLEAYLAELCQAEGVAVGQGVLSLVVRAGAGSVRDSLSVLDQLIAGCGPDGLDYALAVSLLGYTDATLLDDVVDAIAAADGAAAFAVLDRVVSSGHDPRRFVEDLLERLRDLLVVAAVPDGGHTVLRALPADQLARMRGQAGRFGRAELSRAADVVNTALTEMTGATSPRLQLELLMARLLLPGAEDTQRGLGARLDRVEKRLGVAIPGSAPGSGPVAGRASAPGSGPVAGRASAPGLASPDVPSADTRPATAPEASAADTRPATAPEASGGDTRPVAEPAGWDRPSQRAEQAAEPGPSSAADAQGQVSTEQIRRMWPDVMANLTQLKRATWSLVSQHAQVLEYDGQRLVLEFGTGGLSTSFSRGAHQEYLRQALIDVIGLDCGIEAVAKDARSGGAARSAPRSAAAAPSRAPEAAARPAPEPAARPAPQPAARPAPASGGPRTAARPAPARSTDEVPWPDEPSPEDEPPPPEDEPRLPRTTPALDRDASPDDENLDGSGQVGRPVVEQLLGGRVIEESDT